MYKAHGYLKLTDPDAASVEQDSFSCGHCQRVCFVKPNEINLIVVPGGVLPVNKSQPQLLGGLCKVCMRLMCPGCTQKRELGGECIPFEQALAQEEARNSFLKSLE